VGGGGNRIHDLMVSFHQSRPVVNAQQAAALIMKDIESRKGLGDLWREYMALVSPTTRDAIVEAWVKIIMEVNE
jgi:hypothetical protein